MSPRKSFSKSDFDAHLVDWLYEEMSDDRLDQFTQYMEANLEAKAEAEAFALTRSAFREMPEAEPPPALTAILLQQAALAVRPHRGAWARLVEMFQPVLLHPAMSAVATLVLVAGVAGTLYLRKADMVATPSVRSPSVPKSQAMQHQAGAQNPAEALSPNSAAPAADESEVYSSALATVEQEAAIRSKNRVLDAEETKAEGTSIVGGGLLGAAAKVRPPRTQSKPEGHKSLKKIVSKQDDSSASRSRRRAPRLREKREIGAVRDSLQLQDTLLPGELSAGGGARGELQPEPAAVPPSPKDAKSRSQRSVESFFAAARSDHCPRAVRIARDIRKRDLRVYKKEIEGSREEIDCKTFLVVAASRSRAKKAQPVAKTRVSKKVAPRRRAGKSKSVPKKVLAAPLREADAVNKSP